MENNRKVIEVLQIFQLHRIIQKTYFYQHTRLTNLNPTSPAIVIRGASQGNDLGPITDEDSAQLLAAKRQITELITQWVQEA